MHLARNVVLPFTVSGSFIVFFAIMRAMLIVSYDGSSVRASPFSVFVIFPKGLE